MPLSQSDLARWQSAQRRAAQYTAPIRNSLLRAYDNVRASLSPEQLSQYIRSGGLERVFSDEKLDRAFAATGQTLRDAIQTSVKGFGADVKRATGESYAVRFDIVNPNVIRAIQQLDTRVFLPLKSDIREVVRSVVERGLSEGKNFKQIAKDFDGMIGLAPNQADAVANFRGLLESGDRDALTRQLRDARFDRTLDQALGARGTGLTTEQIDRMTNAYAKNFVQFNAETNARTMALDAMKLGQKLSWQDAIDQGIVDGASLMKRWVGVKDEKERPTHLAMEGETVHFDSAFSNGQQIPGDTEFNCRCILVYFETADVEATKQAAQEFQAQQAQQDPLVAQALSDQTLKILGASEDVVPIEAASIPGSENERLEKLGFAGSSPERKAARARDRAAAKKLGGTSTRLATPDEPIFPWTESRAEESFLKAQSFIDGKMSDDAVAKKAWGMLTDDEKEIFARAHIEFKRGVATNNSNGTFFAGDRSLPRNDAQEARIYGPKYHGENIVTILNKKEWFPKWYTKGITSEQHEMSVLQHEMGHAMDWSLGVRDPDALGGAYSRGAFWSTSGSSGYAFEASIRADIERYESNNTTLNMADVAARRTIPGAKSFDNPYVAWMRKVYTQPNYYSISSSELEQFKFENSTSWKHELFADIFAALKGQTVRAGEFDLIRLKQYFPKTVRLVEEAIANEVKSVNARLAAMKSSIPKLKPIPR